jgi:hypothetical protein
MDVSMAQKADLTCPECDQSFSADVWPIVDAAVRSSDPAGENCGLP